MLESLMAGHPLDERVGEGFVPDGDALYPGVDGVRGGIADMRADSQRCAALTVGRGRVRVALDAVEERGGLAALAVDDHDMRPLVEGRRWQARVVRRARNGCHSATEAAVVHDDA